MPITPELPIEQPMHTILMMALLGLILLGGLMIACVIIGGRWVRRIGDSKCRPLSANPEFRSHQPPSPDETEETSSLNQVENEANAPQASETYFEQSAAKETKAE